MLLFNHQSLFKYSENSKYIMTSDEIKQHIYVAMQEKSDYDKALKIIRVFNESLKDAIESGIMLKMLYYQWSGAITKLNKKN